MEEEIVEEEVVEEEVLTVIKVVEVVGEPDRTIGDEGDGPGDADSHLQPTCKASQGGNMD